MTTIYSESDRNYRKGSKLSAVPRPLEVDPYQARVEEIRAATLYGVRMRRLGEDAKADAAFNHARRLAVLRAPPPRPSLD